MNTADTILQKVINNTEQIFGGIANTYPRLLGELDKGIEEASLVIRNFSTLTDGVNLSEFLESCRADSRSTLLELDKFKEANDAVLERLSSAMNGYHSSQENIEEIRDISESLQIVSLNALCNAVKAGKGGGGFSVITGNLKDVTGTTIEKTKTLERIGGEVRALFEQFYTVEQEIDRKRKSLLSMLEYKIYNGIKTFQAESETIDNLFRKLTDESTGVRQSILRIMEELQQQDLIRQTIDQIILSIKELPEGYESCAAIAGPEEDQTDKIVFCIRLINLAVIMINDVEEKLLNTINIFTGNFRTARTKLEYIQDEKEKAVRGFMKNLDSFEEVSDLGKGLRDDSGDLSARRQWLIDLIQTIIHHVDSISGEFASFEKISGWLNNVAVLSRIELSRSTELFGMRESVEDMSELVERIQQLITQGESETIGFINRLNVISEEYREYASGEMEFLYRFADVFTNNISRISNVNSMFSSVLSDFNFFTDEFRELFNVSERELDQLTEISSDLTEMRVELESIREGLLPAVNQKMQGKPIAEWDIKDDNMNRIIEKFTIYNHKKTAGEVSGLEVEDSALGEGEITLF